jgi:hypothetical protein
MEEAMNVRWILLTSAAMTLVWSSGCNRGNAGNTQPKNASAQQTGPQTRPATTASDEESVVSLLQQESGDSAAAGLPSGHPPIGQSPPAPAAQDALPPGHPPLDGGDTQAPTATRGLTFDAPGNWTEEQPSSAFRTAQFGLPRVEGDAEDGELVVYFFGPGQGGPVQQNLDRWRGQFKTPDGGPVPDEDVEVQTFQVGAGPVTVLEVEGRYEASMMPGGPVAETKDDYRMIAAIIEAGGNKWFVKALGPDATMRAHRDEILSFVRSAKSAAP